MEGFLAEAGIRFFVVDYLQLAQTGSDEAVYRAVTEVSAEVMTFAHQHEVVTVGLSQINRTASTDRDNRPQPQGLIGSSSLENDADQVLLLDHTRYERDGLSPHLARTFLLIAKNRHGPCGSLPIEWNYRTLRVREASPDEEEAWPKRRGTG
jgi:replicative DNA helicase